MGQGALKLHSEDHEVVPAIEIQTTVRQRPSYDAATVGVC